MTLHACDSWRYSYNFLEARLSTAESFLASKCSLGRLATMTQVGLRLDFSPEELWSMSKRGNSERAPTAASDYTRQNEDKSRTTQRRRTDALRLAAERCRLLQTKPATQAWPHRAAPVIKGGWCSGITPAQHAGGPGFNPQTVHFPPRLFVEWK